MESEKFANAYKVRGPVYMNVGEHVRDSLSGHPLAHFVLEK